MRARTPTDIAAAKWPPSGISRERNPRKRIVVQRALTVDHAAAAKWPPSGISRERIPLCGN
jgi:hypothetical protein